jgi:uncharacterized membrane protein YeaQ/YmgE (transglycosylase-associated protein family)
VLGLIFGIIISGLVVGALGRLAIPGPNPMSIPMTILVGLGGSIIGGIVGRVIFGGTVGGLLLSIAGAALIVWLMQRSQHGRTAV